MTDYANIDIGVKIDKMHTFVVSERHLSGGNKSNINTSEIPGELLCVNISSHMKITCYFHK